MTRRHHRFCTIDHDAGTVTIASLDRPTPACLTCQGGGWVCENHPSCAWLDGEGCSCGGAGAPCKCSPLASAMRTVRIGKDLGSL